MANTWNKDYERQIVNRILDDTLKTRRRLELTTPGRTMPDGERLTVGAGRQMELAILFLDICGFSKQESDTYIEQKRILAILNVFIGEMIRIVKDFDGEFEKNTGDGLMAYFGTETSELGIMAKNAIDAALTMHYSNYSFINPLFRRNGLPPINFRIGIDLGKITISNLGVPYGSKSLVAIGATANIACRLLSAGRPGEILIGGNVRSELPSYYQQYCIWRSVNTGYFHGNTQFWYPTYAYTGRWRKPIV